MAVGSEGRKELVRPTRDHCRSGARGACVLPTQHPPGYSRHPFEGCARPLKGRLPPAALMHQASRVLDPPRDLHQKTSTKRPPPETSTHRRRAPPRRLQAPSSKLPAPPTGNPNWNRVCYMRATYILSKVRQSAELSLFMAGGGGTLARCMRR